jgi:dipeptidyl aminopeptidase/acylaminoacyl peptidase
MSDQPRIPRRILFGNPARMAPRISPDGKFLAWLEPRDGVINLWAAAVGDLGSARPLTNSPRPLSDFGWTHDGRHLLFIDDTNGNEDKRIWAVTRDTAEARMLTPELGVAAIVLAMSPDRPDTIVVGLNDRDATKHDAWTIDPASGRRELLFENRGGFRGQVLDAALSLRLLRRQNPDMGGSSFYRYDAGRIEPAFEVSHEDDLSTYVLGFERDGAHYLLTTSIGRDRSALFRVDAATGERQLLAEHKLADLQGLIHDPRTGRAVAASFEHVRREWVAIDPDVADDLHRLAEAACDLDFNVYSQTEDGTRWVVIFYGPTEPGAYHVYDRRSRTLAFLFELRPELKPYRFAPMRGLVLKARDGRDLVSYLTLPHRIEGDRPPDPLPMVLSVHGGPWSRDQYGFNSVHQWLADRGYAVLSVNYRGSTGFGKDFVNAGDRQHAAAMHDDLLDAVDWAVREGIAQRDRVAIRGASYGGYATLVGLTFTPEVFCCGASLVGISNLVTMLQTMPPYWHSTETVFYRRYHDPRTEEGRAWLWSRSPLSRVDQITKPLLIGHGQNDVRCKVAESEQIVTAMRGRGLPVRYLVYPDEGHGFIRPENRLSFLAMEEAFFHLHLGGRCEPAGDDLAGSSITES